MKKLTLETYQRCSYRSLRAVQLCFVETFQNGNACIKKLGVDVHDSDANGASHTMSSENGVLHVIGVFNGKLSTIAHECAHMAFDICSRVGVDVEPEEPTRLTAT